VRGAATLLFIGLASLASSARAQEANVWATNLLEADYSTELDESTIDDRLDLGISFKRFGGGLVYLAHEPTDHTRLDRNKYGPRSNGIRKRWVTAETDNFAVRAGDSYAAFGSGLLVRIVEDQAVDFDNVVDGFYGMGTYKAMTLEMIAGTNSIGEPVTVVKALTARFDAGRGWTMGLNGAVIDSVKGEDPAPGRDGLVGAQANGPLPGGIDLTAEYAIQRYKPEREGRGIPDDGHGAYGAASGSFGPVSVTLEGKDLLRFEHAYAIPPTVVPQHATTLLGRGSHVPNIRLNDEYGGEANVVWRLNDAIILMGDASRSLARHDDLPAWELYGTFEGDWRGNHIIGYTAETEEKVREGVDRVFYERITYGGDWLTPVWNGWSAEVGLETQKTQEQDLATAAYETPLTYRDNVMTVTISKSPRFSWAATIEWTDEERADRENWSWFSWMIRCGTAGQLTLSGGTVRGGMVCSGGICKLEDPFTGGRLEFLTNF
jgi:hypothetical protein